MDKKFRRGASLVEALQPQEEDAFSDIRSSLFKSLVDKTAFGANMEALEAGKVQRAKALYDVLRTERQDVEQVRQFDVTSGLAREKFTEQTRQFDVEEVRRATEAATKSSNAAEAAEATALRSTMDDAQALYGDDVEGNRGAISYIIQRSQEIETVTQRDLTGFLGEYAQDNPPVADPIEISPGTSLVTRTPEGRFETAYTAPPKAKADYTLDGVRYSGETNEPLTPPTGLVNKGTPRKSADGFWRYPSGVRLFPDVKKADQQGSRRYQNAGGYVNLDTGEIIEGTFDTHKGDRFIWDGDNKKPIPKTFTPITKSDLHMNAVSGEQFQKLVIEVSDTERSLRQLTQYMSTATDASQGWSLLADQFLGHMNTIFGEQIADDQMAAFMATGQLQGLLGAYRIEVGGPGVMTEQDAKRIISRLGGDFNLLRNKEVASMLIRELMEEKLYRYDIQRRLYNAQIDAADRGEFEKKDAIKIDESIFSIKKPAIPNLPAGFEVE
ncbi:MAG: hypothetical protein J3T61_00155 [Candidatus Brocadiales bacterium]|nr:hypothetical protein [Candidatus Bathyanammoxibius sp.]